MSLYIFISPGDSVFGGGESVIWVSPFSSTHLYISAADAPHRYNNNADRVKINVIIPFILLAGAVVLIPGCIGVLPILFLVII